MEIFAPCHGIRRRCCRSSRLPVMASPHPRVTAGIRSIRVARAGISRADCPASHAAAAWRDRRRPHRRACGPRPCPLRHTVWRHRRASRVTGRPQHQLRRHRRPGPTPPRSALISPRVVSRLLMPIGPGRSSTRRPSGRGGEIGEHERAGEPEVVDEPGEQPVVERQVRLRWAFDLGSRQVRCQRSNENGRPRIIGALQTVSRWCVHGGHTERLRQLRPHLRARAHIPNAGQTPLNATGPACPQRCGAGGACGVWLQTSDRLAAGSCLRCHARSAETSIGMAGPFVVVMVAFEM